MARNSSFTTKREPYEVWITNDSRGQQYAKAFVPSKQGFTEIALYDWSDYSIELQGALLDPLNHEPWKHGLLDEAYAAFRQRENERKHAQAGDPQEHLENLVQDDPTVLVARSMDAAAVLDEIFSQFTPQQRVWLTLHFGDDQYSFAEIARMENANADEETCKRRANTIGRAVKRAVAKIRKEYPNGCPLSNAAEDV